MHLSCEFAALKIFGFGNGEVDIDGEAGDVLYASYLSMARAGLASLELWDPKSQKWGQPHCQARFAILKVSTTINAYTSNPFADFVDSASSKQGTISADWTTKRRICLISRSSWTGQRS